MSVSFVRIRRAQNNVNNTIRGAVIINYISFGYFSPSTDTVAETLMTVYVFRVIKCRIIKSRSMVVRLTINTYKYVLNSHTDVRIVNYYVSNRSTFLLLFSRRILKIILNYARVELRIVSEIVFY